MYVYETFIHPFTFHANCRQINTIITINESSGHIVDKNYIYITTLRSSLPN